MNNMKKIVGIGLIAIALGACDRIDPGHVGIMVNLYGSDRGVEEQTVLGPGSYWTGFTRRMYEFPTYEINFSFTRENTKESPGDESVYFQSTEGLQLSVDIGLQYQIDPNRVPIIFQQYRRGVDEITRVFIRNMIRDAYVEHSSKMRAEDIIGSKKSELVSTVEKEISDKLKPIGINIKSISMISGIRMPASFELVLNEKNAASQRTLQREQEVAQSRAEAQKKIEEARGIAESLRIQAEAEASSLNIRGDALRKNPEMLQLEAIQKWNGSVPQVVTNGQSVPFISIPNLK